MLRSLPDCLDSEKTKLLSRNLFLVAWFGYRIQGKPKITIESDEDVDIESRLTLFQRFTKRLIESDEIENGLDENDSKLNEIVSSFITVDSKQDDKELFLFLRRVTLSEYFLLNKEVCVIDQDYFRSLSPFYLDNIFDSTKYISCL